jgi:hypothetical protein
MAYEAKTLRRQKLRYNNANDDIPLLYQLTVAGDKVTPTSATITIYKPGSTTAVVSAASMTVSGTLLSYVVSTTTTANYPVGIGYRAHVVVTVSSTTYEDDFLFDVAKFIPFGKVTRDQLVAMDERVSAYTHDNDDDLSEVIEAAHDILQFDIETKAIGDKRLLEDMLIDPARVGHVLRYMALSLLFRERSMQEEANFYRDEYNQKLKQLLSSISYADENQDLEEDSDPTLTGSVSLVN